MSRGEARSDLFALLMRGASAVAGQVNDGVVAGGHQGLRPAHGLVFMRVAGGGATVSEIAADLGVTKQSAAAIVDELVVSGHVRKEPHPRDRRAQLVRLTEAGIAATEAATEAATAQWESLRLNFGAEAMETVARVLEEVGREGTVRPVW